MSRLTIPVIIAGGLMFAAPSMVSAADNPPATGLEERVARLEKRLDELETRLAPVAEKQKSEDHRAALARRARERWAEDNSRFTKEQLAEIEKLYQVANRQWRTPEAKASLEQLVEKYANANRTGCALLYLGRMSEGPDQEKYLKRAVEGFSDCWYGDGTNVGAYARLCLAQYYRNNNRPDEAGPLYREVREKYADMVDHSGRKLGDLIPKDDRATTTPG